MYSLIVLFTHFIFYIDKILFTDTHCTSLFTINRSNKENIIITATQLFDSKVQKHRILLILNNRTVFILIDSTGLFLHHFLVALV